MGSRRLVDQCGLSTRVPTMPFSPDHTTKLRESAWRARRFVASPVMTSLRLTSLVLLFSATGNSLTRADDSAPSPYAATLRQHGIAPNAAGLGEYLRQLNPDEQQQRKAIKLIEQLGSERFVDRTCRAPAEGHRGRGASAKEVRVRATPRPWGRGGGAARQTRLQRNAGSAPR